LKSKTVEDILGPHRGPLDGMSMFLPTTDDTFFPHSMEDGMKNLVEQDQSSRKPILMGFNRNEGSFLVLLSQKFKAGSYDVGTFIGTPTFDSLVQWWSKEAKEDATVMEKIRDKYYNRELSGLIDFFGEEGFNCEVTETSDKLKDNGHQVDTYRFDMFYDFAQNVFEYLGASHMFELHALFLRPFHNLGMYTPLERTVSVNMVTNWGAFAHGVSSFPSTSEEEAFVIAKKETTTWEKMKIDTKRCHFLHCIPSIFEHSKTGMMSDTSCMEYLMSGAGKIEISILTVFAMVAVFLNTFTS
jgi:carboxylesterase type B